MQQTVDTLTTEVARAQGYLDRVRGEQASQAIAGTTIPMGDDKAVNF
jgi:hypothetical protein